MEQVIIEAIKGLNQEKLILAEALTRVSHNQSIQIRGRLMEIGSEIKKLTEKIKESKDVQAHSEPQG